MKNTPKWDALCIECQSKNNGTCESEYCKEMKYDPWGDPYPFWVFGHDYGGREEYIANKRKRMEEQGK